MEALKMAEEVPKGVKIAGWLCLAWGAWTALVSAPGGLAWSYFQRYLLADSTARDAVMQRALLDRMLPIQVWTTPVGVLAGALMAWGGWKLLNRQPRSYWYIAAFLGLMGLCDSVLAWPGITVGALADQLAGGSKTDEFMMPFLQGFAWLGFSFIVGRLIVLLALMSWFFRRPAVRQWLGEPS